MKPSPAATTTILLASALVLLDVATAEECNLTCKNAGQCVFEWQTAPQANDAFIRVMACQCAPGFTGPQCEIPIEDEEDKCNLECDNGGECVFEWMAAPRGTEGYMYQGAFMACDCPEGYTGLKCEHEYETCPDGNVCLNGATCEMEEQDDETEDPIKYRCDCEEAYSYATWAGELCEGTRTEYCDHGTLEENHSFFCANGGKCMRIALEESDTFHHGCECNTGFEGHHCERPTGEDLMFSANPSEESEGVLTRSGGSQSSSSATSATSEGGGFMIPVIAGVCAAVFGAALIAFLVVSYQRTANNNGNNRNHADEEGDDDGAVSKPSVVIEADGTALPERPLANGSEAEVI